MDEIRTASVPIRHSAGDKRPLNPKCWIIPPQPSGVLRRVEFRNLIEDLAVLFQRQKSVGKTLRHVEHLVVVSRENFPNVLCKRRRFRSQINNRVIDGTACTTNQFGLRVGRNLIVHSAKGTFLLAKGNTTLHQSRIEAVRFELPLAPTPSKESPIIFQLLRLYDECTFELGLGKDHQGER